MEQIIALKCHLCLLLIFVFFLSINSSMWDLRAGKNYAGECFSFHFALYFHKDFSSLMEVDLDLEVEDSADISYELDPKQARFPCCVVWTPLPIVSWLAPFIGHVGICKEDGTVLDFSGSNIVTVDDFAFGSVARYLQLEREQRCFPQDLIAHKCQNSYAHAESGSAISWDDAIQSSARNFEHKSYNLFTCNSHSFVANCLNRLCYEGSMSWNMVNVAALVLSKGKWVDGFSVLKSFLPFLTVMCLGIYMVGRPFFIGSFSLLFLLIGWFLLGAYSFKNVLEC